MKVLILFGMKILRIFLRVSLNNSLWELISMPLKAFPQLKGLIATFMALVLAFL